MSHNNHILEVAKGAARSSAEIILKALDHPRNVDYKGKTNLVTQTDRDSELNLISIISRKFPDHSILGEESGKSKGLNFIGGNVKKLKQIDILPLVGFQAVYFNKNSELKFLTNYSGEKFYFIHSYHVITNNIKNTIGHSKYKKIKYCVSDKKQNIFGTQFHPEKSGEIGLNFLKSYLENV